MLPRVVWARRWSVVVGVRAFWFNLEILYFPSFPVQAPTTDGRLPPWMVRRQAMAGIFQRWLVLAGAGASNAPAPAKILKYETHIATLGRVTAS